MSRLDAVAEALGVSTDEARQFTRAVRAQFEAAPSYAQILRAIKDAGGRPSPQQVVVRIRQGLGPGEETTRRGAPGARGPRSGGRNPRRPATRRPTGRPPRP